MILCHCTQITESEFRDYYKEPSKYYTNDDFMIRINEIAINCGSCEDRLNEIIKELKNEK